ncbi:MAG TPA: hypothetical protein PKV72_02525 [Candidatus Peribacteria bacterium]|nr:hypothetical protein [Candidatus Peribacteria bacterium]
MNIHPLVVHFPIALLCLYSALEVVKHFTKAPYWTQVRAVLVITGTAGAFASLQTGEIAEELFGATAGSQAHDVLEMHSLFATVTTWVYAVLAASYVLLWLKQNPSVRKLVPQAAVPPLRYLVSIAKIVLRTPIAPILAVLGFVGLGIVGALGATLVYGPDFDPMTSLVNKMLFKN